MPDRDEYLSEEPLNWYWEFERTDPLPVEDGIVARSRSGKFTSTWWASQWVRALTEVMSSARLSRGRAYARRGQVMQLDVQVGRITALVQGTRPTPYRVTMEMETLDDDAWDRVVDALAGQATYAAQLLNGEMPRDIERVFRAAGVSLFPAVGDNLETACTCPDWANPCKHTAAVCLLVGERLDEDPFLLFLLRGRSKSDIIAALRDRRATSAAGPGQGVRRGQPAVPELGEEPLEACLEAFWRMGEEARGVQVRVTPPEVEMEALKLLGEPNFAPGEDLTQRLAEVYRAVSRRALEVAFGEE